MRLITFKYSKLSPFCFYIFVSFYLYNIYKCEPTSWSVCRISEYLDMQSCPFNNENVSCWFDNNTPIITRNKFCVQYSDVIMFSLNQSKVQYLVIIELLLNQQEKNSVGGWQLFVKFAIRGQFIVSSFTPIKISWKLIFLLCFKHLHSLSKRLD